LRIGWLDILVRRRIHLTIALEFKHYLEHVVAPLCEDLVAVDAL
jgi:hypothetical protein